MNQGQRPGHRACACRRFPVARIPRPARLAARGKAGAHDATSRGARDAGERNAITARTLCRQSDGKGRGAAAAFLPNSVVQQKAKVCSHAACRTCGRPLQRAVNLRRNPPFRPSRPGAIAGQILSAILKVQRGPVQHAAWKRHVRVRRPPRSGNGENGAKLRGTNGRCLHRVP